MMDFCFARSIASEVEVIPIHKINEAYERLVKGNVKYRFVIDLTSLKIWPSRQVQIWNRSEIPFRECLKD